MVSVLLAAFLTNLPPAGQTSPAIDVVSTRIDPYVERSRVIVLTDIANEPDDQMSMVRFLVYANQ